MNANNNNELIKKLAFESIDDIHSYALYSDFKVTMNTKNGYINATKLCADGGKLMKNWMQNNGNKEMIKCFGELIKSSDGIPSELLIMNMSGSYETRGTYVHPDLIPHIASWVSPAFAYKVSKIVNNFLIREKEADIERLTGAKTRLELMLEESNRERRAHEERAEKMLQDMKDQNEKTHVKLDEVNHKLDKADDVIEELQIAVSEVNHKLDKADNDIEELQITLDEVNTRIEIVMDEVVNPENQVELREGFGIMKLNEPNSKYGYKAYCAQNKNLGTSRKNILREFPNATLFLEIKPNPNSKNVLHKLKELYGTGKNSQIKVYYNFITILDGVSEDKLSTMVNNVVDNAKNYGVCGISP
jgi:hypothetical protein